MALMAFNLYTPCGVIKDNAGSLCGFTFLNRTARNIPRLWHFGLFFSAYYLRWLNLP